jgi:hypothetical protein
VENLPLNGRAYADLAALVPGVRRNVLENSTDSSRDASFNVNGQRSEFNNFLLDGLDNNAYGTSNQGFSNQAIPPSPDAIDEFRVETDNYSAEYGRSAGAVINVSIRSGTNQFHGKAYDYIRNTVLNAIGPFTPTHQPAHRQAAEANPHPQPVRWHLRRPHLEGSHSSSSATTKAPARSSPSHRPPFRRPTRTAPAPWPWPTAAIPSSPASSTGAAPVPLLNPLTGQTLRNGVIPFSTPPSPLRQGRLAALPAPNVPGDPFATTTLASSRHHQRRQGRRPRRSYLQPSTNAFVRYSQHQGIILSPPNIQGPAGGNSNGTSISSTSRSPAASLISSTRTRSSMPASPSLAPTAARARYGANLPSLRPASRSAHRARHRCSQPQRPERQATSRSSATRAATRSSRTPTSSTRRSTTLDHGRSTYKVGYEYQAIFTTIDDFNPVYGQDTYNGGFSFTGATVKRSHGSAPIPAPRKPPPCRLLFGARDTYQLNNFVVVHLNQRMHYFYFQDDIRVNSRSSPSTPVCAMNS